MSPLEAGVITFAETFPVGDHGDPPTAAQRLQQVIAEACAAEQAGLATYGVGEHHRPDFVATALGCSDPVRVFQDFATLDLL